MPEERKLVTVLFADIVGSTSLTGAHDAEVVQAAMDAAFARIAPVIRSHGGSVEKFIGDAVMSVFGVPAAHDDDAQRGVRAAFAIRDAVAGAGGPLPLEVRVGVNTGEAVARTDVADQRMVTGIAVNFAQRLQSAAQPGEILVGEVTHDLTKGAVRYGSPRTVQAKGIGDATAFVAEALLDATPEQHRGLQGLRASLIGRDRELRMLNEVYARTRETREPHLVTVYGPAGAGKSRLVDEFAGTVSKDRVRRGRCLPYGEGITYYPLQQILREDAGIEPEDTRDSAVAKLRAATSSAMGADERDPVFDRLRVLAGLAEVDEALADVPRDQLNEELRWGLRRYFERRAATDPLVIVFEDIHWAEPKDARPRRVVRRVRARPDRHRLSRAAGPQGRTPDLGLERGERDDDRAAAAQPGGRPAPGRRTARERRAVGEPPHRGHRAGGGQSALRRGVPADAHGHRWDPAA
jgi:class 3 adenylate cyclase